MAVWVLSSTHRRVPRFSLERMVSRQLQIPPGVQIQLHELACGVILQLPDVRQGRFFAVVSRVCSSAPLAIDGRGHFPQCPSAERAGVEVVFQQRFRTLQSEQLLLSRR